MEGEVPRCLYIGSYLHPGQTEGGNGAEVLMKRLVSFEGWPQKHDGLKIFERCIVLNFPWETERFKAAEFTVLIVKRIIFCYYRSDNIKKRRRICL